MFQGARAIIGSAGHGSGGGVVVVAALRAIVLSLAETGTGDFVGSLPGCRIIN